MKREIFSLAAAVLVALPLHAHGAVLKAQDPVPGQYVVVFADGLVSSTEVGAESASLSAQYQASVLREYSGAIRGFAASMPAAQAEAMSSDPRVAFVEESGYYRASTDQAGATWGIDRIDQHGLPLNNIYSYGRTGTGVTVYVIDTGIRVTHAEFGGRATGGFTSIIDPNGTNDCNGHGTHVSGTIGGSTFGVAKGVQLVPVRVLDCNGQGTTASVVAGIDWVTMNHAPLAVANMSLGGGASAAIDLAVEGSIDAGVTYVVAAGNENVDACTRSPARVPAALTVGATTAADARAIFSTWGSNSGTCLDLFAPGHGILSAWRTSDTATNTSSGTSMAAPHVAGAAAIFLQQEPTATPARLAELITSSATGGAVTGPGAGSPNRLLYSAPVAVTVAPASISVATNTTRQFTASVAGTSNTVVTWALAEGAAGGTVTPGGLYTAPATPGTYHLVATSTAETSRTAIAIITVFQGVTVSVAPSTAALVKGATQQFSATVTGSSNTAVTWSVAEGPAGGSVTSAGLYSAPTIAGTYHVVATSLASASAQAIAAVRVFEPVTFVGGTVGWLPPDVRANDVLVAVMGVGGTPPAGWNEVTAVGPNLRVLWRRATGAESGWVSSFTAVAAFRGVVTSGEPFEALSSASTMTPGLVSLPVPSIATQTPGAMLLLANTAWGWDDWECGFAEIYTPSAGPAMPAAGEGWDNCTVQAASVALMYGAKDAPGPTGPAVARFYLHRGPVFGGAALLALKPGSP